MNRTIYHFTIPGKVLLKKLLPFLAALVCFRTTPATAQTDTTKAEEAEPEAVELISPAIDFTIVQLSNNTVDLKAIYKAKIKGSFTTLPGLKVKFYCISDSGDSKLGETTTTSNGIALLNVPASQLKADASGNINVKTVFTGNKTIEAAEEPAVFKRALLTVIPVKEDSLYSLEVKLVDLSTGTEQMVPEATVGIYVQRMFSPLKIGEGTTDENGAALVEIPNTLPGDAKGNLALIARLDESEAYGNLEASVVQPWGIPVSDTVKELPRALWSTHPPIWMLVTFIILMSTVWGHYLVIIIQLFRLKKDQA